MPRGSSIAQQCRAMTFQKILNTRAVRSDCPPLAPPGISAANSPRRTQLPDHIRIRCQHCLGNAGSPAQQLVNCIRAMPHDVEMAHLAGRQCVRVGRVENSCWRRFKPGNDPIFSGETHVTPSHRIEPRSGAPQPQPRGRRACHRPRRRRHSGLALVRLERASRRDDVDRANDQTRCAASPTPRSTSARRTTGTSTSASPTARCIRCCSTGSAWWASGMTTMPATAPSTTPSPRRWRRCCATTT